MSIAFGSISTGLPKDIVQQIIKAERIPIKKMMTEKSKIADRKKLVDDLAQRVKALQSKMEGSRTMKDLREFSVDTNQGAISVSIDKDVAGIGNYKLEVVRLARPSSAMTSGFASPSDSYTGVGFIRYYLPSGEVKELYVDEDNASLDGIARLINNNEEMGISASVVNDGKGSSTPWRLILTLKSTGDINKAQYPYFYFVDGEEDLYLEKQQEGHDGVIKINGFEIEVGSNSVKDLIPGATIDLKKAQAGKEFDLNIKENTVALSDKLKEFIDVINHVFSFIVEQSDIDENTDTSRTLGGDIILQTVRSRLQRSIFKEIQTVAGKKRLSDLGITFSRSGLLQLDENRLDNFLAKDYGVVGEILTGSFSPEKGEIKGVLDNIFQATVDLLSFPSGTLSSRQQSLRNQTNQIDRRIQDRERLIQQKETALKEKFARLEETMSRIRTQGAGLASLGTPPQQFITKLG